MSDEYLDEDAIEDISATVEDDYYALLAVDRTATSEEIANAYRRLSKLFHPDKHTDPVHKKNAENMFNKIKKAHEVLTDDHQRAIYDTLGVKGLETEGWEIIARNKSSKEIREEYEKLVKQRERQRLEQRTNPKGAISLTINATDVFERYEDDEDDDLETPLPSIEMSSLSISQSIDMPLTQSNTLVLSGSIASENGRGQGNFVTTLRHVVSAKTWLELQLAVGQGPLVTFKGFRTISKRSFASAATYMHFSSRGLAPGIELVLGKQLDKHLVGYLTWKGGIQKSMNTSLVWNTNENQILCGVQFGIPNSFVNFSYTKKLENGTKFRGGVKLGSMEATIEYGAETKISQHSLLAATMIIGVPTGVRLRVKLTRSNQSFIFPILLSEEILPSTIFYGSVIPVLVFYSVKTFVINPYNNREKRRELDKLRSENASKLGEKRKAADATKELLKETYRRIVEVETNKKGLIIMKAIYGKEAEVRNSIDTEPSEGDEELPSALELLDVTVQLQCLIKDSGLSLPPSTKANLPGFYDPCLGDEKILFVRYKYRELVHCVIFNDADEINIPHSSHLGQ
ncbi:DnaJ -like protein subfamily C member 11 [Halotydeus destructor]|nr:DnaJ -like protein subfamily C member 11 [Halotydeus destructor]